VDHEVPLMPIVQATINQHWNELEQLFQDKGQFDMEVKPLLGSFNSARIEIRRGRYPVAGFELEQMPGCCAMGTTSYLWAEKGFPGAYELLTQLREEIGKAAKWGILVATLTDGQSAQMKMLENRGWVRIYQHFRNPKTGNGINILVKDFTKE